MSQDQQAMMSAGSADSLAADMPSVPGAETAKSIIEDAVHPYQGSGAQGAAATPGVQSSATGAPLAAQQSTGGTSVSPGATAAAAVADAFVDQVFDIPIMGEALTFSRRAVVTEEVRLQKRPFTAQESVSDTARRERVTVEGADVVEGADSQLPPMAAESGTGGTGGTQGAPQGDAQNVQQGASDAKHGIDNLIDSAVDKIFGGHNQ